MASRPDVSLPGSNGRGVTIALLDTGVDANHPYVLGQVSSGYDVVGNTRDTSARPSPEDPTRLERHGTQMAGLLVGSEGPGKMNGVAPGATVLPIRVAGWQREASGRWAVYGRTDQLIAGLERAVDPNLDGVALDAARIALVGVAEPFAAFEDSPSARAVAGALRLDTLVVAPAGNDGLAGPGYGSISGPGGSRAALTVGAADLRDSSASVRVVARVGLGVLGVRSGVGDRAGRRAPARRSTSHGGCSSTASTTDRWSTHDGSARDPVLTLDAAIERGNFLTRRCPSTSPRSRAPAPT